MHASQQPPSVEAVTDSSRYFVLKIVADNGRSAHIGMGFSDRADSFDMNVTLQDHFQGVKKEEKISKVRGEVCLALVDV